MAGWRDKYRQASFRGVPFFVKRAELQGGRRTQLHTYPNRDIPYSEDLGRAPRIYAIDAFVIGDDFFDQKETLIRALEEHGPGKLVHPYYGDLLLACRRYRVTDSDSELRMARVNLELQESGELVVPTVSINTPAIVNLAKTSALIRLLEGFIKAFDIALQAFAEVRKVVSTVQQALDLIDTVRQSVGEIAEFQREITSLADDIPGLIANVTDLGEGLIGVTSFGTFPYDGEFRTGDFDTRQMFDEILGLFDFAPETPNSTTSPVKAVNDLIQIAGTVVAGGLIAEMPFQSFDAAQEAAANVFVKIDALLVAGIDDDDLANALRDLRDAIVTDIEERSDSLPRLGEITLPDSVPAIVLSNDLYGDLSEEDGIVARNGIDHPGFVDGLRPIKVLIGG